MEAELQQGDCTKSIPEVAVPRAVNDVGIPPPQDPRIIVVTKRFK